MKTCSRSLCVSQSVDTLDVQTVFYTQDVSMFVICVCTKFQISGSNGVLVIAMKLKAKYILCIRDTLFYTLLKY
jgi:hypothetical protein